LSIVEEYLGIVIDKSRDSSIPEKGMALLTKKGFYKKDGEDSPQKSFARAATCYSFGDYEFAQRIYEYASQGWFTFASPVLSTALPVEWPEFFRAEFEEAGDWLEENVTADGLPISCFLSYVPDTKEGLVSTRMETAWLSMMGGGIGVFPSNRSPDEKSTGVMAHLRGYDADSLSYKQSESRRGSIAAYLNVDHPEILQFVSMRDPASGGDINQKCFNLNNAVNITDSFMEKVIRGEDYELIDPKHGPTGEFLNAREVWELLMEVRHKTGEPYLNFIDTVNRDRNPWITKNTYSVTQSNLCNEIHLMTSEKRTAVCCLSSLNLAKYDEWKGTGIVKDLVRLLDNVLEYFIRLAPPELSRAVHSASQERAIGLGTLGFHSILQKKEIPFESGGFGSAVSLTHEMYSLIESEAIEGSKMLAKERGEPEDCIGSGMRNSHLLAIAPNASSSDMVGESPSIEPWAYNCFTAQGRAGSFLVKNKYLEKVLEDAYNKNNPEVWKAIAKADGSVQWIDWMSEEHKKVFKTSREIDPLWIVELAAIRQEYIDQGQSVNLFKNNLWDKSYMSDVHMAAWAKGLKGLYYMRGEKAGGESSVQQPLNQQKINYEPSECLSCQG
jgi:ribonucleoside-diphosphate reductase alpha chain